MNNSKSATVSKKFFLASCTLAVILLFALIWCLFQINKRPADLSLLEKAAAVPETRFIPVIKEDATVELFLPDGSPAEPCGDVDRAKVDPKCNIKGRLVNISTLTIFTTESSPGCTGVYNSAGYLLYYRCS